MAINGITFQERVGNETEQLNYFFLCTKALSAGSDENMKRIFSFVKISVRAFSLCANEKLEESAADF